MGEVLQAFGVDWRLIVIQVFNFALLLAALWYFLYTPVLKILKERQEKIERGVNDAEAAKVALDSADEEKKSILTEAHSEAEEINKRAKVHADERAGELAAAAEIKAENLIKEAETRGEDIKKTAKKESEAEVAKVAILAAEKVLREKNA